MGGAGRECSKAAIPSPTSTSGVIAPTLAIPDFIVISGKQSFINVGMFGCSAHLRRAVFWTNNCGTDCSIVSFENRDDILILLHLTRHQLQLLCDHMNGAAFSPNWKTLTFLAALRSDRIDAPFVLDGPINGKNFVAYIKQILVPTLSPGDIVIIDNLCTHKSQAVRKTIREAGAKLLFLPPYSPDLNPIEQVFAKLKTLLRKAAERAVEATWKRIGTLLNEFKPQERTNYLRNFGSASN